MAGGKPIKGKASGAKHAVRRGGGRDRNTHQKVQEQGRQPCGASPGGSTQRGHTSLPIGSTTQSDAKKEGILQGQPLSLSGGRESAPLLLLLLASPSSYFFGFLSVPLTRPSPSFNRPLLRGAGMRTGERKKSDCACLREQR